MSRRIRLLAVVVLALLLALPMLAGAQDLTLSSTDAPPPDHAAPLFNVLNTYPLCDGSQTVLLLQDVVPWNYDSNVEELTAQGRNFCVAGSSQLGTLDLDQFAEILLTGNQTQGFYNNLFPGGAVHPDLALWVRGGGILSANLIDYSWSGGGWLGRTFVGNLTHVFSGINNLQIVAPTHPVIADALPCPGGNCGPIVDDAPLNDLDFWSASTHGYFTDLPDGAVTILADSLGRPVMVEYPFGAGRVIATLTTTEWMYGGAWQYDDTRFSQNRKLLANEIAYQDYLVKNSALPPQVEKSVFPTEINLAGTGGIDTTKVTLTVTGAGGTETTITPMDVVFALDSSGSMGWNDPGGLRKTAAKDFLDKMDPARDAAGVVSWDDNIDFTFPPVSPPTPLSSDFTTVKTNINSVDSSGATNMELGLSTSVALLDNGKRPDTLPVIIFLSNGAGDYTGVATADAASKGYVIYTIGLGSTPATGPLTDMATRTGGTYYPAPTPENLQAIFDAIYEEIVTSTVPYNVSVIEVTQAYIVDEGAFNVAPDSVTTDGTGITTIVWNDVGSAADSDPDLDADETVELTFTAKSNMSGSALPVDVLGAAKVCYENRDGLLFNCVDIPQATLDVNAPPDVSGATASVETIWKRNHKMVPVTIEGVSDGEGDNVTITITAIEQDEPVNGGDDGDTAPDASGVGTDSALLCAERCGIGDGRVYEITFVATDEHGAASTGSVLVTVPLDRDTPVGDDGFRFDSTVMP